MNKNVQDLVNQIKGLKEEDRRICDELAQRYISKCIELFQVLKAEGEREILSNIVTGIGVTIHLLDINAGKIDINGEGVVYLHDNQIAEEEYSELITFEKWDEDEELYCTYKKESMRYSKVEIEPFVRALQTLGFKVYVDSDEDNVLVPFFVI